MWERSTAAPRPMCGGPSGSIRSPTGRSAPIRTAKALGVAPGPSPTPQSPNRDGEGYSRGVTPGLRLMGDRSMPESVTLHPFGELRPDQGDVVDTILERFERTDQVLLSAPTGTGKTAIATEVAARL